jgi:predicted DNA-binding transcriptional regulator AlpA
MAKPSPSHLTDNLLTGEQVAERLGKQERTIRQWRMQGRGFGRGLGPKWVKIGGSIRYWESDVEAWAASQPQDPTPITLKTGKPRRAVR